MKHGEWKQVIIILTGVIALFFYQTLIFGKVPIPADSLVSEYKPWRSTSYLGYGAGGIPNKAQYPDTIRQMYPWKTRVVSALTNGRLPLWNPYNFSGTPLLANFQSAALYPLGLLYLLASQIDAWTILVILQPLLAVLFTYLYARKVGMHPLSGWLAAFSYGFSGFMAVWLEYNTVGHVILWLPLMLLAIEHLRSRPHVFWLGILTLTHAASLLAGHPQVYAYTLAFFLLYATFRLDRNRWAYAGGFTLLGIGVAGLQLIPGMELITLAARSPHDPDTLFTKILIQPVQLLSLPLPNIFGNPATRTYFPADTFVGKVTTIGLVPLFFSLSVLRRKDKLARWFILASIVILMLITANPVTYLLYRIPIPIITSSSPTLMAFLLAFSLSLACGLGLDHWMTDTHSIKKLVRRTLEVFALFGTIFLLTKLPFVPLFSQHGPVITRALLYGGIIASATLVLFWVAIALPKLRVHAISLLIIVHVLDLFIFFQRFNPFVPKALVFPEHAVLTYLKEVAPHRYWGYATAGIAANFASQYGIFSPEGYDPLYPRWYGEFLYSYRSGSPLKQFDNTTRSDAAVSSSFGDGGLSDTNKRNVLDALSVRYILDRTENTSNEGIFPPSIFKKVQELGEWSVYENTNALPRAYLAHGTATILTYEPERVSIRTQSSVSSTLILTDTYYPGWTASVDGKSAPVERTNWTMRGVQVPAGIHEVVMTYKPLSVRAGATLSVVSFGGTILSMYIIKRKKA